MELRLDGEIDVTALRAELTELAARSVVAARKASQLSTAAKNDILSAMAAELELRKKEILTANQHDVQIAENNALAAPMVDRLRLTPERFHGMVQAVRDLIALPDPVGKVLSTVTRPNGLEICKIRVPIGVIAIIYESRPNVTVDAASICMKTSNVVILRGGRESICSNEVIARALQEGGAQAGLPDHAVQLLTMSDRRAVHELVQLEGQIDLVIPRGGESLIRAVTQSSRIPVLKHYKGVCHIFVDAAADPEMALAICENAKCQRPGVCNAMETLLVHERIAPEFLPKMAARLRAAGVELRGDEASRSMVSDMKAATEADWHEEYVALILSVKIVADVQEAMDHIAVYGSKHTDAIISASQAVQEVFVSNVDSGVVLVNASTRFNDGGEFGFGAEMGISTDKLHARGPVGPEELTTYKYIVRGSGQIRE